MALRRHLGTFGGLVLSPEQLNASMGYELPSVKLGVAGDLESCDLYVDVKAHQIHKKLVRMHPRLQGKVLWYRINGGEPERVPGCGDEVTPPCPVLTPNQWYKASDFNHRPEWLPEPYEGLQQCTICKRAEVDMIDGYPCQAYPFWPQLVGHSRYNAPRAYPYSHPVCLIHNINGWGYQDVVPHIRAMNVRIHGRGSPDGLVQHTEVPSMLRTALCMVHLKSNDAPGYAILEALAAGCPVVCSRRLIWRCRMDELLIPNKTCLVFDRETHDPLSVSDVQAIYAEVNQHLVQLRNRDYNGHIGEAGRKRLMEVMWTDKVGFTTWMQRMFP